MKAVAPIALPRDVSERQRTALLKLLADEDPAVFQSVRKTILAQGPVASEWLRAHFLSNDAVLRRRSRDIVLHFERQEADNRFLAFCLKHGQDLDLEEGAWLLARTQYPEINPEGYRALLDQFAQGLREKIDPSGPPKQMLQAINEYVFEDLAFAGNEENYYDPDNSYLNRVMDRRTGNPIGLCLVYLLLARRLQLPIAGIGLPGHFVCRYQSTSAELYIDAFNRGRLLAKADCVQYLVQSNYSLRDEYLAPVSPRRILLRICSNLHHTYLHLESPDEATRVQRYLVALAK